MDQSSQRKVINAGFSILRCQDEPKPIIKVKDKQSHEWRYYDKFETKAARDRAFKALLELDNYICD